MNNTERDDAIQALGARVTALEEQLKDSQPVSAEPVPAEEPKPEA